MQDGLAGLVGLDGLAWAVGWIDCEWPGLSGWVCWAGRLGCAVWPSRGGLLGLVGWERWVGLWVADQVGFVLLAGLAVLGGLRCLHGLRCMSGSDSTPPLGKHKDCISDQQRTQTADFGY